MKHKLVTTALVLFALMGIMGCGGGDTIQADVGVGVDKITYDNGEVTSLIVKVVVDGTEVIIDLAPLIKDRTAAMDNPFPLTVDELRDWLCVSVMDFYIPYPLFSHEIRAWAACQSAVYDKGVFIGNIGLRGALGLVPDDQIIGVCVMYQWMGTIPQKVTPPCG